MLTEDYQTQNVILTQMNDIYFHREEKKGILKGKKGVLLLKEREKGRKSERKRERNITIHLKR